ncbi:MAG: indole-3-glycerol phosphate synthase TrpC [Actinomycetota bacterium]|nr:indole-3-glycerol phosphate synthase TrpC [Actinomycetota bacterium]
MATFLDRILAAHRAVAERDRRPLDALVEAAADQPPARPFTAALRAEDGLAVIAEVKRRSPSRGELAPHLVPGVLAKSYADGGAACLSVLTDAEFFGGSPGDLEEARAAVELPVLRKDFTVSERDVCDARLMGADAVLLIAAALSDAELSLLHQLAVELGLAALVEVHDAVELGRALAAGATLVGVNQRDLVSFEVDRNLAERLAAQMPPGVAKVAESGVRDARDAERLCACGYDAILVGEALVTASDPAEGVRRLRVPCS